MSCLNVCTIWVPYLKQVISDSKSKENRHAQESATEHIWNEAKSGSLCHIQTASGIIEHFCMVQVWNQECVPVGCVPSAAVAVCLRDSGGFHLPGGGLPRVNICPGVRSVMERFVDPVSVIINDT